MHAFKKTAAFFAALALAMPVALVPAPAVRAAYKEVCLKFEFVGYIAQLSATEVDENGEETGWSTELGDWHGAHTTNCVNTLSNDLEAGKRYKFFVEPTWSTSDGTWCDAHSDNSDAHPGYWLMPDGPPDGKLTFQATGAAWSPKCQQKETLQMHSMCNATYDGMEIGGCQPFAPTDTPTDILHWVIRGEHGLGKLGAYVKNGANPNAPAQESRHFGDGNTPLHIAAWLNRREYVRSLIDDAGADVNARSGGGETPLLFAVSRRHEVGLLNDLLERGADGLLVADNGDAPILVALGGRNDVVRALVGGAAADTLHRIIRNDLGVEMLRAYAQSGMDANRAAPDGAGFGPGNAALHIAAWLNRADYARALLDDARANVNLQNGDGHTPLSLAVARAHPIGILNDLLSRGADANIAANNGDTPVLIALRRSDAETLRTLAEGGADLNRQNENGDSPLAVAARDDDAAAIQLLLDNGANPHLTGPDGDFPLYIAARDGKAAAVRALLDGGADVNQAHENGKTPLSVARKNESDSESVLENLRAAGAGDSYPAAAYDIVAERRGAAALRTALRDGADINHADADGQTALHLAAEGNLREYLAVLTHREFAAEMNAADSAGRTPLLLAVLADNADVWGVRALLHRGADADAAGADGDFPLYVAVENARPDIARLLASARANLDACHADENKTALTRAEELTAEDRGRYWDVYQLLVQRGAAEVVANCGN